VLTEVGWRICAQRCRGLFRKVGRIDHETSAGSERMLKIDLESDHFLFYSCFTSAFYRVDSSIDFLARCILSIGYNITVYHSSPNPVLVTTSS
jgi:hypothetical protein